MIGSLDEKIFFKAYLSIESCYDEILNRPNYNLDTKDNIEHAANALKDEVKLLFKNNKAFSGLSSNEINTVWEITRIFFTAAVKKKQPDVANEMLNRVVKRFNESLSEQDDQIANLRFENLQLETKINDEDFLSTNSSNLKFQPTDKNKSKEEGEDANAFLKLVVVTISAAISGFVGAWYMLAQLIDCLERYIHNEDTRKAARVFVTLIITAVLGNMTMDSLAAKAITDFARTAGMTNPIAWTNFCVGFLGMAVAGASTYVLNNFVFNNKESSKDKSSQDKFIDSMRRFTLSQTEQDNLTSKHFDPISIQCVIIALVKEMHLESSELPLKFIPSYRNLFNCRKPEQKELLEEVRSVRSGKNITGEIEVGELKFNLNTTSKEFIINFSIS